MKNTDEIVVKDPEVIQPEAKEEKPFKFPFVDKIQKYAKENPKQSWKIMIGLVVLSLILTVGRMIYIQQVSIPKYKKMSSDQMFGKATKSLGQPMKVANDYMDIKNAMKELEFYKQKSVLTKNDSLRIEFLIDKYQNSDRNEKN